MCHSIEVTSAVAAWQVLVPPLRELEGYIFERLFRYLWQKALLESVSREPSGGPAMFSPQMMTPIHKASQHEDAIQRWLDALQVLLTPVNLSLRP